MKPYQLNYHAGGSAHLYDIPDGDQSILDSLDSYINSTEESYRLPGAIILNHNAYSRVCSALSHRDKLKRIKAFISYRDLPIFVISVPGHDNHKYQPYIFGAPAVPSETDFFRSLNQEQFNKEK